MRKLTLLLTLPIVLVVACSKPADPAAKPNSQFEAAKAEVSAALDGFYAAAEAADYDAFITLFADDAMFFGTDATEQWTIEEFGPSISTSFADGEGWEFDPQSRIINVLPGGKSAWFAELTHFKNTDYLLRPTGVLTKTNKGWKISQIVMGIPIPNDLYQPVLQGLQAKDLGSDHETGRIETVLDQLHSFAAQSKTDPYFNLFADDAIFIGTDVSERWTKEQLANFAKPYFEAGNGWRYTVRERHIVLGAMSNTAWFDEILDSETYGTARGTGVLERTPEGWKIKQYHLTFPIPNDVAGQVTGLIKIIERGNR